MRIITGSARGCRLKTPKGQNTRPTADRIKESLFNILQGVIEGRMVLDLFAGTGNLGLEALSRGAEKAVFIDQATAALVQENAEHTHLLSKAEILRGDSLRILSRFIQEGKQFDLIFCDPPYRLGLWEKALTMVDASSLLAADGWMVVEHGKEENTMPSLQHLERVRNQSYGSTTQLSFFRRRGETQEVSS